jgi:hypothetical protein
MVAASLLCADAALLVSIVMDSSRLKIRKIVFIAPSQDRPRADAQNPSPALKRGAVSSGGDWEKKTLTRLLRETHHGPDLLKGQTHNKNITSAVVKASQILPGFTASAAMTDLGLGRVKTF